MAESANDILSPLADLAIDDNVSRPGLKRRIHSQTHSLASTPRSSVDVSRTRRLSYASLKPDVEPDTRLCILHDIAKTDSLIGISLAYGISAAALRKANKLWERDDIHLRKSLSIPIEACTLPPAKEDLESIHIEHDELVITFRPLQQSAPSKLPLNQARFSTVLSRTSSDGCSSRSSLSLDLPRSEHDYLASTNSVYDSSDEVDSPPIPPCPTTTRRVKVSLINTNARPSLDRPPVQRLASFHLSPELSSPPPTPRPKQTREASSSSFLSLRRWSTADWKAADDVELSMASELERNAKQRRDQRGKKGVIGLFG